jgi:hypothetical protein
MVGVEVLETIATGLPGGPDVMQPLTNAAAMSASAILTQRRAFAARARTAPVIHHPCDLDEGRLCAVTAVRAFARPRQPTPHP